MKKIDRRIIIVIAFVFIVGLAFGLMRYLISLKDEPPVRRAADARRYVRTEKVEYATLVSPVTESGRVRAVNSIDMVAEASGKIIQGDIELKKGASFSKGDLLFTIYKDEALLALKGRKSQFMNTLANLLPDLKIDYPDYEESFVSFFRSIEINKPLPDLPDTSDDKLRIFLSSRNVLSEYYSIQKDELQVKRHSVYAPFNGTYSDVYMEAQAYTNTGGRVAHAIRTDLLEMEVPVRKDEARWINIGDEVSVVRDKTSERFTGKVARKSLFLDESTQTQSVFVRLQNNPGSPLLIGEYLKATFPGHPVKDVMEAPRNAVFNSNEVFIVVDERLEKRDINVVKFNEKTLIFNGLDEGDLLVTQALINVQEGTPVTSELKVKGPSMGSAVTQGKAEEEAAGNKKDAVLQGKAGSKKDKPAESGQQKN